MSFKRQLAHPLTRGFDFDWSATTSLCRRIVREKGFLRQLCDAGCILSAQCRVPDRSSIGENLYPIDPARATQRPTGNPAGDAADGVERQIDGAHHVVAGGERVGATENARPASNGNETAEEYRPALASNAAAGA